MRLLKVNDDLSLDILPEVLEIPEFKAIVRVFSYISFIYSYVNHCFN